MKLQNLVLVAGLATVLGGCVVEPRSFPQEGYYQDQGPYYDDYYDYHDTPSYDGYYDVRVIFIGTIPYYVDDDRHIRPIPPQYRDHFLRQPYMERNRRLPPPMFSREREVRDGYPMSRIVYMDGVPYYVDNDRGARPLPNRLHERFRYAPMPQDNLRPQPPMPRDQERRDNAPAYMREQNVPTYDRDRGQNTPPVYDRGQNVPPAYGREREQNVPPAYGREREQNVPPAYGREREQNVPPAYGREREQNVPPVFQRDRQEQHQEIRTQQQEQRMTPGMRGQPQGGGAPIEQRPQGNDRTAPANRGEAGKGTSRRSNGRNGNGQDNNADKNKNRQQNRDN